MSEVSIVTCTYNRAHLIGETIKSVLNQTFGDFEYIIVDDGSEDNTEEVVKSFDDARIKYLYHSRTNGHLSKLRNFAHTKCSGDFIAYIDSDDVWESNKLALQIRGLKNNSSIGYSFTDVDHFNEKGIIRKSIYNKRGTLSGSVFQLMLQNRLIICHTTLVFKKICFDKIGAMDESMHSGDHDFVFFLSRFFDAYVIYEPLVHVRKHSQNSTGSNELSLRLLKEHHKTLDKLLDQELISTKEYTKSVATSSYSFGIQLLNINEFAHARSYFLKCLSIQPWNLKCLIRLFMIFPKQIFGRQLIVLSPLSVVIMNVFELENRL